MTDPTYDDIPLSLDAYQAGAKRTALYPLFGAPWVYPALGLANEAGEVLGKLKKIVRDDGGVVSAEAKAALASELGDVLWYLAALAGELGLSLGEIGQANLDKLADRAARDAIRGSGDQR
jgi:NTP pyrophosphatase (non-canonical NTP hydrolase)